MLSLVVSNGHKFVLPGPPAPPPELEFPKPWAAVIAYPHLEVDCWCEPEFVLHPDGTANVRHRAVH